MKKVSIENLMSAISRNDVKEVESLLSQGVDLNAYHKKTSMTPLMAASIEGNLEIVDLLLSNKADVSCHSKDSFEFTALHYAVNSKKIEVVKTLIEHGADVNAKDAWGNGTLFRAINNESMMILLLEKGADASMQNKNGSSPANSVAEGFKFIKEYLKIPEPAKTNQVSVFKAVKRNDLNNLMQLIKEGADLNKIDETEGKTAMHIAVEKNNMEAINLLLDGGAKIDAVDEYGGSPLATAIILGNFSMTKYLVEKGASPYNKDKFGNTLELLAKKYPEILNYLSNFNKV